MEGPFYEVRCIGALGRSGKGKGDPSGKALNVSALAADVGIAPSTARYRMQVADELKDEPDLTEQVEAINPTRASKGKSPRGVPEALRRALSARGGVDCWADNLARRTNAHSHRSVH